nr:hypothetical protein B0A51_00623 [Rachicladosporium sp. CCFEE 5018]
MIDPPAEMWMAVDSSGMSELAAAWQILLPLEQRAWTHARSLAAITTNGHAACSELKLSMRLMRSSFLAPVSMLPLHMSTQFKTLPLTSSSPSPRAGSPQHLRSIVIEFTDLLSILTSLESLPRAFDDTNRFHPPLGISLTPLSTLFTRALHRITTDIGIRFWDSANSTGNAVPYIDRVEVLTGLPPLPFQGFQHCQHGVDTSVRRLKQVIERDWAAAGVVGEVVISRY